MATIFSDIGIADNDRVFSGVTGQQVIYDRARMFVAMHNAAFQNAVSAFVEKTTDQFKFRARLAGGGRMQKTALGTQPAAVRATGSYDVALPLWNYTDAVVGNDVALAYMTAEEFQLHLTQIVERDTNTRRFELLKALFNENQDSWTDPIHGSLNVEPLANGDAVVYPPVNGSEDEATENHYLESGYAASAISDTNNPYVTMVDDLSHHYPGETGDNIVTFIHGDQVAVTRDLTDWVDTDDRFIRSGADADIPVNLPSVPGSIIGRLGGASSTWVSKWSWIPTGYMLAVNLDATPPLQERVDASDTGLPAGLQLIAQEDTFPLSSWYWRSRYGYGAVNRLNGVVMELGTGGTYTTPTAYA